MQFSSISEFISMGGYGFYVWLSFGISALLLIILFIDSKKGHKRTINAILKRQQREDKLRQAKALRKQQKENQQSTA